MTFHQWLEHIESLHHRSIDLSLDRVSSVWHALMLELGQSVLAPVITVGGTNGKGSTVHMLHSIFVQAGYRVGLYTSPHLVSFTERIKVNHDQVTASELCEIFALVENARQDTSLTYFEFATLAALCFFSKRSLDVVILEVGLGGRLDATNIIDSACSVITSIGIDHAQFLGKTREDIGCEKAGIMRQNQPVVIMEQDPPSSLLNYAKKVGARPFFLGQDFSTRRHQRQWDYHGIQTNRYALDFPALRGAVQVDNAAGALAVLELMSAKLPVSMSAIRQGLALVNLPGRFQVISGKPTVILDVAHNQEAVIHLAHTLKVIGFRKVVAVFGAFEDKPVFGMMSCLKPYILSWYGCGLPSERACSLPKLENNFEQLGVSYTLFDSPIDAFKHAWNEAEAETCILVFGSFITVGMVLQFIEKNNL